MWHFIGILCGYFHVYYHAKFGYCSIIWFGFAWLCVWVLLLGTTSGNLEHLASEMTEL